MNLTFQALLQFDFRFSNLFNLCYVGVFACFVNLNTVVPNYCGFFRKLRIQRCSHPSSQLCGASRKRSDGLAPRLLRVLFEFSQTLVVQVSGVDDIGPFLGNATWFIRIKTFEKIGIDLQLYRKEGLCNCIHFLNYRLIRCWISHDSDWNTVEHGIWFGDWWWRFTTDSLCFRPVWVKEKIYDAVRVAGRTQGIRKCSESTRKTYLTSVAEDTIDKREK